MKKLISIAFVCALAACGSKAKTADTTATKTTEPAKTETPADTTVKAEGQPCAQEIAMVCPEGQVDGCLKTPAEGTTHTCVAK